MGEGLSDRIYKMYDSPQVSFVLIVVRDYVLQVSLAAPQLHGCVARCHIFPRGGSSAGPHLFIGTRAELFLRCILRQPRIGIDKDVILVTSCCAVHVWVCYRASQLERVSYLGDWLIQVDGMVCM